MNKQSVALPIRKCIYCLVEKKSSDFNKEHVIPQNMGKFENGMTIKSVCKTCNSFFGEHVDPVLADDSYEALLRAQSGIKQPTVIDNLKWERINITIPEGNWWSGARLKLAWDGSKMLAHLFPQLGFRRLSTGAYEFYTLREAEKIEDWSDLSSENFKLVSESEEDEAKLKDFCRAKFGSSTPFKEYTDPPPQVENELEVDCTSRIDSLVKRAAAKIAFNYLSKTIGPDNQNSLLAAEFDDIRKFIRTGQEIHSDRIDVKVGNQYSILRLSENIGVRAHLIALEKSPDGALHCRFSPYDHFHYDVILSRKSEIGLKPVGHVFFFGEDRLYCEELSLTRPEAKP